VFPDVLRLICISGRDEGDYDKARMYPLAQLPSSWQVVRAVPPSNLEEMMLSRHT
jgi:hypothetical protein